MEISQNALLYINFRIFCTFC